MTTFRHHRITDVKSARLPAAQALQSHIKREFFSVSKRLTVGEVITLLRANPSLPAQLHVVALINAKGEYQGLVTMAQLISAHDEQPVAELCQGEAHFASALGDAHSAAQHLCQSVWPILPVLDSCHRVMGVLELPRARAILRLDGTPQPSSAKPAKGWQRLIRFWK
ncbi:hypothetical protein BOO91_17905 [Vibrio navarrensis]|uniref:CBS domain-containing protein n=1 Tax=Vibrio navarrensis TaxID=29495 RepID=A0AAJ4LTD3_9VIBR|nr:MULTISPECIES: hypothetical protein [Vibrio]KJR35232.1 hypothetical protein UF06_05585 [Vibrio sp. S234-5]MBE3654735.1 hypothetical protein [Vibrio navarrensis]MBE3656466.1 hypothetical protein [Vibrio navarrensis]MBE3662809.1 hypothetical protein [Vibrio navarrensis]MBE3668143.1 hypothetical protein [Vibrio navarrensis]